MGDRMTPIPFGKLMHHIITEKKQEGAVFGVKTFYKADPKRYFPMYGQKIETPFGPAAGPQTQLSQNIIAAYCAGARFFELKTVQKLDGDELPVSKPCILANDEGYNVEWSTELYVHQAFEEYVKAWFSLKVMAIEFGLGAPDGFSFNMSVGYDLEGIQTPKIDRFIEGLKDATETDIFKECTSWLLNHISDFANLTAEQVLAISPQICDSITLSTLHGCPPKEIERIAEYLLTEKNLNTYIKCNPTLLGYDFARRTLDKMGFDYIAFGTFHFEDDLQYADAVPLLARMMALADKNGLGFGVKLTNTFPVDIKRAELPGEEMYMSGRVLYPLSIALAAKLSEQFDGKLRISYSGGADINNIRKICDTGIWPITMATTVLKAGGYQRFFQIAGAFSDLAAGDFKGIDVKAVGKLADEALVDKNHQKPIKSLPDRKIPDKVPLVDCFIAPCTRGCPIGQDIPAYLAKAAAGNYEEALDIITAKNPLPFITGTICSHPCMDKCTRNFYDCPVDIRGVKLESAKNAYRHVLDRLAPGKSRGVSVAVVGGGPAGMAAAYFLAKNGIKATIFEKTKTLGGTVRHVIPDFRIAPEAIDLDASALEMLGVEVKFNTQIKDVRKLLCDGFDYVIVAIGATERGLTEIPGATVINAIDFLEDFKKNGNSTDLGENILVIGGGNTAMDTARAALRTKQAKKVSLVYRRTKKQMPADAHELELALADGVEFIELSTPEFMSGRSLQCRKNALGECDASGRPSVMPMDDYFDIAADTVIAAVGEGIDKLFYSENGFSAQKVSADGKIFLAGDGLTGPATVVEAIKGARDAAEAILGMCITEDVPSPAPSEKLYLQKGFIRSSSENEADRCLSCGALCGNCVDVCPNRANVLINVPGHKAPQVIHVDMMCNECGNCTVFCPYSSDPYKEKFTLFASIADMENSTNSGFVITGHKTNDFVVRVDGRILNQNELPSELLQIITAVIEKYSYLA